ncbi:sodium/proton-translocating pyrophosphatase [bacterium]|nr:sodium/proton-translocating pyrophosphatase [bacterium]
MDDYYIYVPLAGGALAIVVVVLLAIDLMKRSPGNATMIEISSAIQAGSRAFLRSHFIQLVCLTASMLGLILIGKLWRDSGLNWRAVAAMLIGTGGSALVGWVAMWFATHANARAMEAARTGGVKGSLRVALGGGGLIGLAAAGVSLLSLCAVWRISFVHHRHSITVIAAYALGASIAALPARLAGGIHAKAADIGADLARAFGADYEADDLRNPVSLADQLGDNLAGVFAMIADLMESYACALVAALAIGLSMRLPERMLALPLLLAAAGIACTIAGIVIIRLLAGHDPRRIVINGAWATAILFMFAAAGVVSLTGDISSAQHAIGKWHALIAIVVGTVCGGIVGSASDYFASSRWSPARRVAAMGQAGPALNVIESMRLGAMSCMIPAIVLAAAMLVAWEAAGVYGIALAAVGMVATAGMSAALNACAPIADNACGISEMARHDRSVREITGILDSIGNTAATIGKGYAGASAALASAALIIGFVLVSRIYPQLGGGLPYVVAGLLVGAALPGLIGSMICGAVASTATAIVAEARRQLAEIPGIDEGKGQPDYAHVNELATRRALRAALIPAAVLIALPIALGAIFGAEMVAGLIVGAVIGGLITGFQAIHTGGALDHAKKYIEEGMLGGLGSAAHESARIGDSIGDALKDAAGPAMFNVMKLTAVLSLVIAALLRAWAK